ncbi:hypothetical protein MMC18_004095 [Xylographa bjoerkii]|nr:hypothetical protein [Xylographa bjoerkii]
MDLGDFDDGLILDKNHHYLPQRSSQSRSFGDEPEQNSANLHEHFHALHIEAVERTMAAEEEEPVFRAARTRKTTPLVSATYLRRSILEMKERILNLEKQIAFTTTNEELPGVIGNIPIADSTRAVNPFFNDSVKDSFRQQQMIPQLCERSWSDFMNKQVGEKCEYAIEVLIEEPKYYDPTEAKRIDRRQSENRSMNSESKIRTGLVSSGEVDEVILTPERIRINSHWILNMLASIDRNIDTTGPIVMLRPFKFLVYYENQIKDSIHMLENQVDGPEATTSTHQSPEPFTTESSSSTTHQGSAVSQDFETRQTNIEHIRCLTEFINRYIKPTVVRLENKIDSKIRFADLWYIFRPGDDIYMPLQSSRGPVLFDTITTTPEMFQGRYHMMWRITGTGGGRQNLSVGQRRHANPKHNPFKVNCYYIDFDGRYFCPTTHTFSILPFEGKRDILSFDFFPLRFWKAAQHHVQQHVKDGKNFFDNLANSTAHFYYAGPTLTTQPCGCPIQNTPLHQEQVESEVIVDFKMTLIKNPLWRPNPSLWKDPPTEGCELQERYPIHYWNDYERAKVATMEYDHIYDDYDIDEKSSLLFKGNELIFAPIASCLLSNASMVPERDFFLLPGRVFAFVLRTRSFAPLSFWLLQPIKPQIESLHNLQLKDDTFKDTIQALVRTHFIQKNAQQTVDFEYDVVRGKGKGLVILLHGAPGVGKTFTAESVAAANGKPLFQITCGDLGLTPREVEKTLKEIFQFAQLWNCVLLLDECDIFLAQRSKNEIKRNSLVSVFLRVLEFYTGVLFLTTNRVGVLDDAIKSRITWIAYYPPLDQHQTKKIWKLNIKLLEERNKRLQVDKAGILKFAKEHFASSFARNSTWNGRQIQNAFKVATALAEWDAYSKDVQHKTDTKVPEEDMSGQPALLASHFHTIAVGTQAFNNYLQEATGYTEAERAFNAMERVDDYAVEDNAYDGGSITILQDNNRNQLPLLSSLSPFSRQRRSSSKTAASPQSFGRASSPLPHLQTARRRASDQRQQQGSLLSPGKNPNSIPPPQSQYRTSSSQLKAVTTSVDPQLQSPQSNRSSYNANLSQIIAPAVTSTFSPLGSSSLRAKNSSRHRNSSSSAMVVQDSYEDDDDTGNWLGSSENEGEDGGGPSDAASDEEINDEDW